MRDDLRLHVLVLFGGRAGEYEVSCASAADIVAHLDRERYSVQPVRVTPDGEWVATLGAADVVIPALHGPSGGDGRVQAVMDSLGVRYVGCGMAASALGMDKDAAKRLVKGSGLRVADWVLLRGPDGAPAAEERTRLGLPVLVKPARSGFDARATRVTEWHELDAALAVARKWDERVLVEAVVIGREVDVAVLELPDGRLEVGPMLETRVAGDRESRDLDATHRVPTRLMLVPAQFDGALDAELRRLAVHVFELFGCRGLARIGFLVPDEGGPVFNEIGTFPAFTARSPYPKIWEASGLPFGRLLDVLLDRAVRSEA